MNEQLEKKGVSYITIRTKNREMVDSTAHNPNFSSAWWSADLPHGWRGVEEERCVTISQHPRVGVLQITAARNPEGVVTDQDLKDFAEEHIAGEKSLVRVIYESFLGFSINYTKGQLFWREWWLRSGNLMIYATYNVKSGKENIEKNALEYILRSLRPLVSSRDQPVD